MSLPAMQKAGSNQTADFSVSVIDTIEGLQAFIPEWRAFLETQHVNSSLYQDPDYIQLYLSERRATVLPQIIVLRRDQGVAAIAPCFLETTRFAFRLSVITLLRIPMRRLRMFGDALIVAADTGYEAAARRVFEVLQQQKKRTRFAALYLETLPVAGNLYRFLQPASPSIFRTVLPSPVTDIVREIHLRETFQEYMAGRSKNFKQNINRRVKQFHAHFSNDVKLITYTTPESVPELLDKVDNLFRSTWQSRTFGGKQRNTPEQIAFTSAMAERGWLRSYVLEGGGQPIAYILGYQHNDRYYYEEPGYDQAWRAVAPGTVLMYESLRDLFENNRPAVFDFGFGENQYKRQLANAEHEVCAAYVTTAGPWLGALAVQRLVNRFYVFVREFLKSRGWDNAVRNFLKRKGAPAETADAQPSRS